jgi:mono/diheme cytochrome c family protein
MASPPGESWPKTVTMLAASVFAVIVCVSLAHSQDGEEADDRGLSEYEIACMPCHGVNGKGDGPDAAKLSKPPTDLSRLEAENGGNFPDKRVRDMIDGRAAVKSHGPRDMPVWGRRYRVPIDEVDTSSEADKRARALIDALVEYLKTLQER